MIERVWRLAAAAVGRDAVFIATDDQRIVDHVSSFGGQGVMTPVECENGTERLQAAVEALKLSADILINMQGDAPLTPPWFVSELIEAMRADADCQYATPAVRISRGQYQQILDSKEKNPFSGTFVTFDRKRDALYFSKQIIPALRTVTEGTLPLFKHIGMYGYRRPALAAYLQLTPGELERVEGLEQLRILEHGLKMKVVDVAYRGRTSWAVDSPEDIAVVEAIIDREGELLPA